MLFMLSSVMGCWLCQRDPRARFVENKQGDDLHSLLEFSALQFGLPWRVKDVLLEVLQNTSIPWGSAPWLKSRPGPVPKPPSFTGEGSHPGVSKRGADDSATTSCVFVGVTSCRRFPLFNDTLSRLLMSYGLPRSAATTPSLSLLGQQFQRSLSDADRVLCHITVVDDGSSNEERHQMLQQFGDVVEFVFRPRGATADTAGHASSMNLLLSMAASRGAEYFLYLEDDWSLVPTEICAASSSSGTSNCQGANPITAALSILGIVNNPTLASDSTEPLVQVHLNSQSAKACA